MLLKLMGSVFLLFAGTMFGFYQAMQYARRPKQIRQLIGVIQRLETEVSYGLTPLPDALLTVSRQSAEPISGMLSRAGTELRARDGRSMREIWEGVIGETWNRSSMKKVEKEITLELGYMLGRSDSTDQVKHLRLAASQLQVEEAAALEDQRRYEKMWRSLGVLVGALAVILMY
ncbi:stage III sporulation protein AB [Paenibacillus albiflavus]|uniref:Stage III sporulation protein AB n=1 Tax=Paenibacillus albiflavus TaxID=2545760 RepID=A0A4R4EDC9_9BACL|nr:stage III sporulation protein SpoIIIAB [Paenibacillus albiflavus]TCZ77447.1 stage III sporulation protein AB [Paenibacillus albiflavus]